MVNVLELFAGTGSVGKVAKRKGWNVISNDNVKKFKPDILEDILKWN
jgi:adenine-specific DNA methylase